MQRPPLQKRRDQERTEEPAGRAATFVRRNDRGDRTESNPEEYPHDRLPVRVSISIARTGAIADPRLSTLRKLAEALKLTVGELPTSRSFSKRYCLALLFSRWDYFRLDTQNGYAIASLSGVSVPLGAGW